MKSLFCKLLFFPLVLVAKPSGMQVVSGKASCQEQSGELVINSSKRAVVKWDEFSIGKGETVRFVQPDSKSAILNRVTGARSELLGQLHSNGRVYLLNPKGILIGKDAVINTAAFVASTLDALDEDFLRGKELLFSGNSQEEVVNFGTISCLQGDVALIGHRVINKGKIEGDFVGLASGPEILLHPKGNQRIFIKAKGGDGVNQDGEVKALVSELRSGSVYDHAICCKGSIEAFARKEENGRIYLVAEEGRTTLEGKIHAPKGEVQLLGNEVLLSKTADVDVSSKSGGGTILVGGDTDPEHLDIFTSDYTWIAKGANLRSDSLEVGDGGRIICWANKFANVFGTFSLRGGEQGGDGGFVEISSREIVPNYEGTSDRRAPKGKHGKLVLDPDADIVINAAGPDSGGSFSGNNPITYTPSSSSSTIKISTLEPELSTGDVLVQTASAPASGALKGNITVIDDISWSTATTLELHASASIIISGGATIANTSANNSFIAMNFHNDGVTSIDSSGFSLAGSALSTQGGSILIEGTVSSTGGGSSILGAFIDNSSITTDSGDVTILATVPAAATITDTFAFSMTGSSVTTSTGNIRFSGIGSASDMIVAMLIGDSSVTGGGRITFDGIVEGATGNENVGISIIDSSTVTSTGSDRIKFTGTSNSDGTGIANIGIILTNSEVEATGSGAIEMTGTGATSTTGGDGIFISVGANVESASGDIILIGEGNGDTTSGVIIEDSTVTSGGALTFDGTIGSAFGNFNRGVAISAISSILTTGSGDLEITGISDTDGTGSDNIGVFINTFSSVTSSSTGNISIEGTGGSGTSDNYGIHLIGGVGASGSGSITMTGIGNGSTVPNHGILLESTITLTTTTGDLTLNGTGSAGSGSGIIFDSCSVSSTSGDLSFTGIGSQDSGYGIQFDGATVSTAGGMEIEGTISSAVGNTNNGVQVSSSTLTVSGSGELAITGTSDGDGAGSENIGVLIEGSSSLTSSSTGDITIMGTGGPGTSTNDGIRLDDSSVTGTTSVISLAGTAGPGSAGFNNGITLSSGASITNTSGSISLSGNPNSPAPTTLGTDNMGVFISGGASDSKVESLGSATISITGIGSDGTSSNRGVEINAQGVADSAAVTSVDGDITITGTSGQGTIRDVWLTDEALVETTGNGSITFVATKENIEVVTSTVQTAGDNTSISMTANSGWIHFITTSVVEKMGSGGTFTITSNDGTTGNDAFEVSDSTLSTTGVATISATKSGGTGNGVTVSNSMVTLGAGGSVTGKGSAGFGVYIEDGSFFNGGTGNLTITGSVLNSANSSLTGIKFDASAINQTGTGTMKFQGSGGNGTSTCWGVEINSSALKATDGRLTLIGTGGNGSGNENHGINIQNSGTVIALGDAKLTLVGRSGEGADEDHGILITGADSIVQTTDGRCSLVGVSSSKSASNSAGINVNSSSEVRSIRSGNLFLDGTGSNNAAMEGVGVSIDSAKVKSISTGNLEVIGRGSTASGASNSHGIYLVSSGVIESTGTGTATCDGTAGTGSNSSDGVKITGSGSIISSSSGQLTVNGRASGSATTGVHVTSSGRISSLTAAPVTVETFSDIILDEGGAIVGGSGLLKVMSNRDITITGGSAVSTPSGIFLGSGNARISAVRDVSLFGGGGTDSYAQIGAQTSSGANITFPLIGGELLLDGLSTNSYALIGHGVRTGGAATFSGNIKFSLIGGGVQVSGSDGAGAEGFAQIGHLDAAGTAVNLSGNININSRGALLVKGGINAGDAYGRIGHGGQGGTGTFGASNMGLIFGKSITVLTQADPAEIENLSTDVFKGNLTFVIDNDNPISPGFAPRRFVQRGVLNATGELRIYTVARALNNIANPINGEVFNPPAQEVDNPQEQFGIYFPAGSYSTADFRIYYKTPIPSDFPSSSLNELVVASGGQLQDLLPIFRYMRLPNYPFYHANFCGYDRGKYGCDPGFDPYGSLNFQDNVYWIGTR